MESMSLSIQTSSLWVGLLESLLEKKLVGGWSFGPTVISTRHEHVTPVSSERECQSRMSFGQIPPSAQLIHVL